jgi:hypothetical protein
MSFLPDLIETNGAESEPMGTENVPVDPLSNYRQIGKYRL